ncbi:putative periplasmic lipoprotein [Spirosoma litoris]
MKRLTLLFCTLIALASCSPTVQVITLRGSNVQPAEEGLIMDNDTLTLRYSFASERGLMHISLLNKLKQPLYVDWKRSSFIIGQNKVDYWYDVADVSMTGTSSRYSRYTTTSLSGTMAKADKISFIPPQTKLEKEQFLVVPSGTVQLSGPFKIEREKGKWVETKNVDVKLYSYSADQSPFTFRNYLTLSTDKDFKTEFAIDTKFWASDAKVLPRDQLLTEKTTGEYQYSIPVPFKQADSFYVPIPAQ